MSSILSINRDSGVGSTTHKSYRYGYPPFPMGSRNECFPSGQKTYNIEFNHHPSVFHNINHSIQNSHNHHHHHHHHHSNDNHDNHNHDTTDTTDNGNILYYVPWEDQTKSQNFGHLPFPQESSEVLASVLPRDSPSDMSNCNSSDKQTESQIHSREDLYHMLMPSTKENSLPIHSESSIFTTQYVTTNSPIMVEYMNTGNPVSPGREGYYHSEYREPRLFYPSTSSLEYQDQTTQPVSPLTNGYSNQSSQEYLPQEPIPHQWDSPVNSSSPSPIYEFENYNLDVPPPDPVKQRRVGRACLHCHYVKKKCSASWPCERCIVEGLDCTSRS